DCAISHPPDNATRFRTHWRHRHGISTIEAALYDSGCSAEVQIASREKTPGILAEHDRGAARWSPGHRNARRRNPLPTGRLPRCCRAGALSRSAWPTVRRCHMTAADFTCRLVDHALRELA